MKNYNELMFDEIRKFIEFTSSLENSDKRLEYLYLYKDILQNSQSIYEQQILMDLMIRLLLEYEWVVSVNNYWRMDDEEKINFGLKKEDEIELIVYINNFNINNNKIRPDLVLERKGKFIVFEFDSFQYHSNSQQLTKDKQRERIIQGLGYPVFRFSNKEIKDNVYKTINEISAIIKTHLYEN